MDNLLFYGFVRLDGIPHARFLAAPKLSRSLFPVLSA